MGDNTGRQQSGELQQTVTTDRSKLGQGSLAKSLRQHLLNSSQQKQERTQGSKQLAFVFLFF
jgi:hypothetical protein